jgi:hypothetical protein
MQLADGLVEQGQHLVGRQTQLLLKVRHLTLLQAQSQEDRSLQDGTRQALGSRRNTFSATF